MSDFFKEYNSLSERQKPYFSKRTDGYCYKDCNDIYYELYITHYLYYFIIKIAYNS